MGKLVPILGVFGGVGVAGLGITISNSLSRKETIKDKLTKAGFSILGDNRSEWGEILESYKDSKNTWKFKKEHSGISDEIQTESSLKEACKAILNLDSSLSEVYKASTKWCVVPKKAEEFVSGLLDVNESNTNDTETWKHNVDGYKATKKNNENKYEWNDVTFTNSEDTKKLKTGCKTRRNKLTYDVEFDLAIREIEKWCSAKKTQK
ncbi:hypothetical protein MHC_01560 [Mycoplasma haemocanis str. Illinois]|uniref:Uncharacterized protein n=1 Tax=Mycoplasma haemocanis (strain Illinois) TaxID=1111676 RepID=H6N6A6_MYCHN|nr:hypothetical protein [Mycoplasma haemocanis]AEW45178.1 hypothetical protein MHC_01560 [Mycoplasma haemocanis str. Illinois]